MQQGDDFDLVVIGSGAAAMAAGVAASELGRRVLLAERGTVGGTCLNVGCVPSKSLLAAAGVRHSALTNPHDGVPTSAGPVRLKPLIKQKDELVDHLRLSKYADVAAAYGFEIRAGHAAFSGPDTLHVNGEAVRAGAFVVATGARPSIPSLAGLDEVDYLTSTTAMDLTDLPASMIVIGAGYVGLEQAQLFAQLGTTVTVVGHMAPRAEPELATVMFEVFRDDGITVIQERAAAVRNHGPGIEVVLASGLTLTAARVLLATGRRPQTDGLNLPAAGVQTDDAGHIVVDVHQASSNSRIFAAGDVTGSPQFVYVAAAAGRVAARNALRQSERTDMVRVDYTALPAVIFTRPQVASAGLGEAQVLAAGISCDCRVLRLSDVPRALVSGDTRGVVKIIAEAGTGRVLGVHAVAEGAGELMLAATYAIRAGMTVDDLADTWAPYLTMAESLRIAAGRFRSRMPLSCCG